MVRGDGLADLLGAVPERHGPFQRVGKGVPPLRQFLRDLPARPDGHVQEPHRGVREVLERLDALTLAGNHLDLDLAVVGARDGDLAGAQVAVPRFAGLEVLGQIDPELHADVDVLGLDGHLGVHDSASRRHLFLCLRIVVSKVFPRRKKKTTFGDVCTYKLKVTRTDCALVPREILMVDSSLEKIGDGLLTTVRVVGKARAGGDAKVVEHEERGEVAQLGGADAAPDDGARAFGLLAGEERELDGSWSGHVGGRRCETRGDQR